MEHLYDVPNPYPLIPLLIDALPGPIEAERFLTRGEFDWGEDSIIAASQAQRYLYFGLLLCFTDCKLDLSLYIHDNQAYLNSYFNRYALGTRWFRTRTSDLAIILLRSAETQITVLLSRFQLVRCLEQTYIQYKHTELHFVCLSVLLLLEHLRVELCNMLRREYFPGKDWFNSLLSTDRMNARDWLGIFPISSPSQNGEVFRKILFRGWCPSSVEVVLLNSSWSTCTYLSTILNPGIIHTNDHIPLVQMQDGIFPFDCTIDRCLYRVNETTYQTRHTEHRCNCMFIQIPDKIWDIVGRGGIALVRFVVEEGIQPYLTVEEAKHDSIYFAVSHVWSGGLGNQSANALPLCQLQKMMQIFADVSRQLGLGVQPPLFWIDTLCIPTRDWAGDDTTQIQASKLIRRRAVDNILSIYTHARTTVVIEPSLQQLKDDTTLNRLHAYILASSWRARCWTFEEASLSSDIFFALRSRVYRVQIYDRPSHRMGSWKDTALIPFDTLWRYPRSMQALVLGELMSWIHDLPKISTDASSRDPPIFRGRMAMTEQNSYYFCHIYNAVLRRATAHETDRFIVLSTMLNFRPSDIIRIAPDLRLSSIVASLQYLPDELLFMDHEPGSSTDRAKSWIPIKVMGKPIKLVPGFHSLTRMSCGEDRMWRFKLYQDERQCVFRLLKRHLISVDLKVDISETAYSLKVVYPDNDRTSVAWTNPALPYFCTADQDDQKYILLIRDAKAIQVTPIGRYIPGVLFRLTSQGSLDPFITYLTPVQCTLQSMRSAGYVLPNILDQYKSMKLDLAEPSCKPSSLLLKTYRDITETSII